MNETQLTQGEIEQLKTVIGQPDSKAVEQSRQQLESWFAQQAPLIEWDVMQSPVGPLLIAVSENGLCLVQFGDDVKRFLRQLEPMARASQNPDAVAEVAQQLREYFAGERTEFDLRLDERYLTPFQKGIFKVVCNIPAGTVWTYGQVAKAIEHPKASRAVGQALGSNPIPIVIPCHRVIGHNNRLTGYGGGIERKRHLLHLERAILA